MLTSDISSSTQQAYWFKPASFFLLRIPLLPAATFLQLTTQQRDKDATQTNTASEQVLLKQREECQKLILQFVQELLIHQALAVASPSLLEGLARLQPYNHSRRTRRVFSRLLRYLIRMSTRPTPFGMFSGVALGHFGERPSLQLDAPILKSIRTRPDMSWVLALIQRIEQEASFLSDLQVVTNQNVIFNGPRAQLPCADVYGQSDNSSIYVHITPPVQFALKMTQESLPYQQLIHGLKRQYPQIEQPLIEQFVKQLWDHHFLQSNLRPPLTDISPVHYILQHLPKTPALKPLREMVEQVLYQCSEFDHAQNAAESITILRNLRQMQKELSMTQNDGNLQTDATLKLASTDLPVEIGKVACRAAEVLFRQSQVRGVQQLHEYRQVFLEKYGSYAEVPLLELLSAENGLGAPPTYQYPPRTFALQSRTMPASTTHRDAILTQLVMQAVNEHTQEIVLTDAILQRIEKDAIKEEDLPLSIEIYLQIQARSREALQQGEWRAVISPNCGSPAGGRTFGRFCDMLGPETKQLLQELIQQEEQLAPDIVFAELTYLPIRARTANVTIRPRLRRYEIAVGITPSVEPENLIKLDDLVVGIRNERFYLRSLRLDKEVRVCEGHMLNAQNAPNVCRFLAEIGRDARPMFTSFDWGKLATAPFLPRVVYHQLIISLAQWNLTLDMLAPAILESNDQEKYQAIQRWRQNWHVPRYVYWTKTDNRLLLDLEHPCTIDELFMELEDIQPDGNLTLQEMQPGFEDLWLDDGNSANRYIAEIVVPLLRTRSAQVSPGGTPVLAVQPVEHAIRNAYPGDEWIYIKLYSSLESHNEIITRHITPFIQQCRQLGLIDQWFFIRYIDTEAHIRLRLHARGSHVVAPLLLMGLQWAKQLAQQAIIQHYDLDTYAREIERYGGPESIEVLERFFTEDSELSSSLIKALQVGEITLDQAEVAVLSLDFLFESWGLDKEQRQLCMSRSIDPTRYKSEFRAKRRLLCELIEPWERTHDPSASENRQRILNCLLPRQTTIRQIATHIHGQAAEGKLWVAYDDLLASIAHMHINRLIGIQRQQEQRIYSLWLLALESLRSRQQAKRESSRSSK